MENKMDELVKLVSEKTGISEEIAHKAVKVVLTYLNDKLPAPFAGQIENLLEGGGDVGDIAGMLGGLFDKKD
jgi:uncharacterized protein (DUF2267 family)